MLAGLVGKNQQPVAKLNDFENALPLLLVQESKMLCIGDTEVKIGPV